ncbi:MAG: hypothetical protein BGO01_13145 [Armatimonadetes bacterium 55-13]|nr:MAG: hypothetical protein BGO01_13145 [Armatimonadetes bacterium 55-13]
MLKGKTLAIGLSLVTTGAICAAFRPAAQVNEPIIQISTLRPTETLDVFYKSLGCFNQSGYALKFTNKSGLMVEISEQDKQSQKPVFHRLGVLKLSAADAKGLDSLLKFYRSNPKGGCTTIDQTELALKTSNRVIRKESYVDASCSASEKPGVITFGELVGRLNSH